MSNALTTTASAGALATADAYDPFASAADDMGASGTTYMKFNGNTGEYTFGADAEELPEGTQLAVNMNNMRRGWICWKDGDVIDEILIKVIDGKPPSSHQLTDHGPYAEAGPNETPDGWREQSAVDFRSVEDGRTFTFKTPSKSGLRSLGQLLKDYSRQYKLNPGKVPVIALQTSSWMPKEKKHGKKYSPVFKIVAWADEDELIAGIKGGGSDNPADYEETEAPAQVETKATPPAERPAPAANGRLRRKF